MFRSRDFIETPEGLVFALVADGIEDGRLIGFLRYVRTGDGLRKLSTGAAGEHVRAHHPGYLHYSERRDVWLHGVPLKDVYRHYEPRSRLRELAQKEPTHAVEEDARRLFQHFAAEGLDLQYAGVTGSLLIGAHTPSSDIDLVVYGRDQFQIARRIVQVLLAKGYVHEPDQALWWDTYARRGCTLDFEAYLWHERRKFNKAAINGRKFDISPAGLDAPADSQHYRKAGALTVRARVADDRRAFDYPACYGLEHEEVSEILCFTATYVGQARRGEWVEASGLREVSKDGRQRLVIGSSREAPGEYIKVLRGCGVAEGI